MPRTLARCRCSGVAPGGLPEAVRARLHAAGIDLDLTGASERLPSGLLWLSSSHADAIRVLREMNPNGLARILVVDGQRDRIPNGDVWSLLSAGAADVITWEDTAAVADAIASRLLRWATLDALMATSGVRERLVGSSPKWIAMLRQLVEVAAFTDSSVLLTGESGVGKEEAARLLHALDPRQGKQELVVLDCTTVVGELAGSEFFGHERGAFTGAAAARDGAFALADGGTLFLDEVGELPPALQAQLLRVIQERTFKRVGANVWQRTDFRLVCATNRDLVEEVARGRFRGDLYHRIAAWSCRLPALRERPSDILPLSHHFLRELLPLGVAPELSPTVSEFLRQREYPGNVRDLRQLMFRIGKRHVGMGPITVGDIPPEELLSTKDLGHWPDDIFEQAVERALSLGVGLKEIGRVASDTAIRLALRDEEGNLQRAARRLGVTDRALQIRRAQRGVEAD